MPDLDIQPVIDAQPIEEDGPATKLPSAYDLLKPFPKPGNGYPIGEFQPGGVVTPMSHPNDPERNRAELDKSFEPLIKPETSKEDLEFRKRHPIVGGIEAGVVNLAEGLTSPVGIATLGIGALPSALQKAVGAAFTAQMIKQAPDLATQLGTEFGKPPEERDHQKIAQLITEGAGTVGFSAMGAVGLKRSVTPPEIPEVQGPYSLGRMLKTPKGAEPTLDVEEVQPLDVQSGSPLTPQELIARQSRAPVPEEVPVPEIKTHNLDEPAAEATPPAEIPATPPPEATKPAESTAPEATFESISKSSPEEFFTTAEGWAKAAMADKSSTAKGPQRMAEQLATENPNLEQWQAAYDDANKQARDINLELSKDPSKMMERQKELMGAGQKSQFFKEGIKQIQKLQAEKPLVGMGGAVPSEFNPEGNEARDVYGIAHEVREARERVGQVGAVERGEGIAAKDSVEHGRQLLKSGVDPEKSLSNFEATGKWSSDDIAVTRAHGERLAQAARGAERKFGTDSPEHKAAFDALTNWDERTKKLQTEWHKAGQAQQGQTDIDTGTFTGLARELKKQTGKDLTPKQTKEAKNISGKVSDAADKAEAAKNELFNQLDKESGDAKSITDAERRALDAANKTVREAAARLAQAETKERVAVADAEKKAARAERAKEQKALDLANKQARDAAVRLADAETKQRIKDAKRTKDDTQQKAAQKALDAANKTVRESAARMAKAETEARSAKSAAEKKASQDSIKREKKALDAANKVIRDAAARAAKSAREENVLKADTSAYAWKKAKEYINSGITNFDDIRNGIATDLGLPVNKVTAALAKTKRAKFLTDELWKKQQEYRRLDQSAKRWLMEQQTPGIQKVIQALPNLAFAAKVFGHGTVALGTHAPMVAFQPPFWKAYANNFVKMYRMVGSPAFYEMQVQNLLRRPNYTTARRAGLVNDPYQFEDYNSPEVTKWMGPVSNMGNRGYSVLKMLRQDMFDAQWNRLPKTQQISEVASALADGINHATGVVRAKAPKGSSVALFAPRLEASRAAWLVADPLRAVKAGLDWSNASDGEKQFAMNQVKEKAWVIGTMLTLLAANEGVLEATGSNQRVNVTDPMKRDWMKFKIGGLNVGYGNAMLSMARLPARLYRIRESSGGKLKNLVYPDEDTYSVLGEFARSQESPFASLATTLWFKSDWQNRPLPNSSRPVPKRLQARGVKPYTWPEFWTEQILPIPLEEGAREVWKNGLGMNDQQLKQARKAMATIAVMAATGARVEEDTDTFSP